jgi:signal transduction histidine kinase
MATAHLGRGASLLLLAALCSAAAPLNGEPLAPAPARSGAVTDTSPALPPYTNPETRSMVALVEAAAREVATRGEASFAEFRRKGGRWFQGDRYIFVLDPQGNSYVYPPDPRSEGVNYLAFQDLGGKPFGRMFVERSSEGEGRGWVHYQWQRPNPDDRRPVWKSTYVKGVTAPSGKRYLVAGGLYEAPMEKAFVVQEVEAAAALLARQGRAAFDQLRDRSGRFFFHDTYVFVDTPDGVELVNPAFKEVEGRNILELRDREGRPMVREYIRTAMEKGSGWTTYLWPRPDSSTLPERKTTFVRKVTLPGGETLIVGSGLYEP